MLTKLNATAKLVENGGTDIMTSTSELSLMSLVGCHATAFAVAANESQVRLEGLEVKAEAVKPKEVGTITEAKLDVTVKSDAPEDRLARIQGLAIMGCPVGRQFRKAGVKISYNMRIQKP